jgi:hypothetical protein
MQGSTTYTFVTDGIEAAIELAHAAAEAVKESRPSTRQFQ